MSIKKSLTKDLRDVPEVKIENKQEVYFFPDINGQSITVEAGSREEAEEKAKKLTSQ
jgi:hypothetical protein